MCVTSRTALRAAAAPPPEGRVVPLSPQAVGLRFTAAAQAAGLERRVTAHSGRVRLASDLTSRGTPEAQLYSRMRFKKEFAAL